MALGELSATVDRFEAEFAVLRFDDGQELSVAKGVLPAGTVEGSRLSLSLTWGAVEQEDEARRATRARKLLTDILQGS